MAKERPPLRWPDRLGFDRIAYVDVHEQGGVVSYAVNGTRHRRPCRVPVSAGLAQRLIDDGVPRVAREAS